MTVSADRSSLVKHVVPVMGDVSTLKARVAEQEQTIAELTNALAEATVALDALREISRRQAETIAELLEARRVRH